MNLEMAKKKYFARLEKYRAVEASGQEVSQMSVPNIKLWLQVRKKKDDPKLPTTKKSLLDLHDEWLDRLVLPLRKFLIDLGKEEKDIDEMLIETNNETEEGGTTIDNLQKTMNDKKYVKDMAVAVDTVDCENVEMSENFI